MNYWNENLAFLKKHAHTIAERMVMQDDDGIVCEWDEEKKLFRASKDDKEIWLGSTMSPKREAEKLLADCSTSTGLVFLLGIANLNLLGAIKKKFPYLKRLVIIEPSVNIFNAVMKKLPIKKIFSDFPATDISIMLKEEVKHIHLTFRLFCGNHGADGVETLYSIGYAQLFPYLKNNLETFAFTHGFQKESTLNTHDFFRYAWPSNEWRNLNIIAPEIATLATLFQKLPVIIVSAGPSLEKNMHLLKLAENRALIIAVGSAVRILDKNGIIPNFRMAIEGSSLTQRIFGGVNPKDCPLIYVDHLYHEIVESYKGNCFQGYLAGHSSIKRYIYNFLKIQMNCFSSGPSVANIALLMSTFLGCKKVILVGQDLSFSNNKNYAKGGWTTEKENEAFVNTHGALKLRDIYGNEVYTMGPYFNMKRMFEMSADWHPSVRFINATEGGLKLDSYEHKTFAAVLQEDLPEADINVREHVNKILSDFEEKPTFTKELLSTVVNQLYGELTKLKKQNDVLKELLSKGTQGKNMKKVKKQLDTIRSSFLFKDLLASGFDKVDLELNRAIRSDDSYAEQQAMNKLAEAVDSYVGFYIYFAEEYLADGEQTKLVFEL